MGSVGDAFRLAEDVGHLLRAGCTLTCCGARRGFQYANFYTDLISVRKFNHSCCFFYKSGSCLHISRSCEDNFQTTIVDMFFARIYPQFTSRKKYSPIHT